MYKKNFKNSNYCYDKKYAINKTLCTLCRTKECLTKRVKQNIKTIKIWKTRRK